MTFLRHSSRHVHHTVAAHVEAGLAALKWTVADETPFGAPVVTFDRTRSAADFIVPGQKVTGLHAGLVTISIGSEFQPDPEELGSGLVVTEIPVFVDIFQDLDAHAQGLAEDTRDIFLGRQAFWPKRFIPVVNQATSTPVPGWTIEFDDIERDKPEHTFALAWQVVKATAMVRFQEVGE